MLLSLSSLFSQYINLSPFRVSFGVFCFSPCSDIYKPPFSLLIDIYSNIPSIVWYDLSASLLHYYNQLPLLSSCRQRPKTSRPPISLRFCPRTKSTLVWIPKEINVNGLTASTLFKYVIHQLTVVSSTTFIFALSNYVIRILLIIVDRPPKISIPGTGIKSR